MLFKAEREVNFPFNFEKNQVKNPANQIVYIGTYIKEGNSFTWRHLS